MEGRKVFSRHQVTMISVATSWERMAWAAAWGQGDTGAAASWRCGTAVQDRAGWEHRVLKAMGDPAGQAGCGDEYPFMLHHSCYDLSTRGHSHHGETPRNST